MPRRTGARAKPSRFFLGHQHVQELAPASEERVELLRRLTGQGARLRLHPLGKEGQDLGIDRIGLGELAGGAREVPDLARIRDDDGQAGGGEGCDHLVLEATGRFQHHQRGGLGAERRHQRGHGRRLVGHRPALARRSDREIQRGFRDIDADEHGGTRHGRLHP
jgi:hypothetical protein